MSWTGWLTSAAEAAPYWPDAVDDGDHDTVMGIEGCLAAAAAQCEAFAPKPPNPGDAVPASFQLAQAMQARALWRAGVAGSGDRIGGDDLGVTVFPMDWTVKNLLRPKRGVPVIG